VDPHYFANNTVSVQPGAQQVFNVRAILTSCSPRCGSTRTGASSRDLGDPIGYEVSLGMPQA
jgi:hypothetical protein